MEQCSNNIIIEALSPNRRGGILFPHLETLMLQLITEPMTIFPDLMDMVRARCEVGLYFFCGAISMLRLIPLFLPFFLGFFLFSSIHRYVLNLCSSLKAPVSTHLGLTAENLQGRGSHNSATEVLLQMQYSTSMTHQKAHNPRRLNPSSTYDYLA